MVLRAFDVVHARGMLRVRGAQPEDDEGEAVELQQNIEVKPRPNQAPSRCQAPTPRNEMAITSCAWLGRVQVAEGLQQADLAALDRDQAVRTMLVRKAATARKMAVLSSWSISLIRNQFES